MRFTRVGRMSYVVTVVFAGIALVFALTRSGGGGTPPTLPGGADSFASGKDGYRADCAACHADPAALAPVLRTPNGLAFAVDLLLRGEARIEDGGAARELRDHPVFEGLPDSALAAILEFVARGGVATQASALPKPVSAEDISSRRRPPR